MRCPSCNHENPPQAKFCLDCGAGLAALCPVCGTQLPPAAKFCLECGHKMAAGTAPRADSPIAAYTPKHLADKILTSRTALEGERKQVTVLFCDIVGSTALAERIGEEQMHALLNRFFELALAEVHRYEGTINQFLGDGFMALFGAPVAHEDHARRAVLAAIDIRSALAAAAQELAAFKVRMGLNTGPVVVGKIGDNLRMDYTAVGDTTNLAARLQQHAEPGVILISEATQRLVQGDARTDPIAVVGVKGKNSPVAAFQVVGRRPRQSPIDGGEERLLSPFVGRGRELDALTDIMAAVGSARGQAVGIVGEPGVGKSRLVYEFREHMRERGVPCFEGRCLSYGSAIPYLPILDLLRADCRIVEADAHAAAAEKVRSALRAADIDGEALPYLLFLLGIREGTEGLREMSPETVKARTFRWFARLVLEQARREALVLIVEDLHWVDKTSEELLTELVGSVAGAPLLILGTYRPGYRPPWMEQSYATQIALRPLSADDSRIVVAAALAHAPMTDDLARSIVEKGDGNPFFLEELARSVTERASEHVRSALPDTVQGVLLARIDRLPERAKRLLQTAAALGREAPLRLLRAAHDSPDTLDADLHELKRQEFLYEKTDAREPLFVFKHVLTQEAAYESLLSGRRSALHEAAGRAIERLYAGRLEEQYELLAHHYSRSGDTDKAYDYLARANRKAMAADAPIEAKGYFERAMALLDALPDIDSNRRRRLALLAEQIVLFQNLFQMQEYYDLLTRYERVAVELNDPTLLGPFVQQIGHCDWTFGRFVEAHERFTAAAALLEATGNYAVAAQTYQIWMWNHLCLGNFEAVLSLQDRVEVAWNRQPNLRWYVYALSAAAETYGYLGRFREALDVAHKALMVAERFEDAAQISFAAWSVGLAYLSQGALDRAIEYGLLGVEKAPTPAERAWAEGTLAAARCRAGEFEQAAGVLAPLFAGMRGGNFVPGERFAPFLGEAYLGAERYDQARAAIEEGLRIQLRHGMRYEAGQSYRLMGELAMRVNPAQEAEPLAEPHLARGIALLSAIGADPDLARTYSVLGSLRAGQGRVEEARDAFLHALEIFERRGVLDEPARVRAALLQLEQR